MPITKIIETQVDTATTAGAATSISSASCVRLFNGSGSVRVVAISTVVGAATSTYFTVPNNAVEFLQKNASDVIWTDGTSIKANKVAFTN
jgi:16S rRNA G966 N2-methylase RsmD